MLGRTLGPLFRRGGGGGGALSASGWLAKVLGRTLGPLFRRGGGGGGALPAHGWLVKVLGRTLGPLFWRGGGGGGALSAHGWLAKVLGRILEVPIGRDAIGGSPLSCAATLLVCCLAALNAWLPISRSSRIAVLSPARLLREALRTWAATPLSRSCSGIAEFIAPASFLPSDNSKLPVLSLMPRKLMTLGIDGSRS
ncbi:hypothetical protein [Pseudomonas sp. GL-B-16]|uniref:hypothetical protein n=1 Tax=Pseudomonas sp. GL-B-16 TaxID=2832373 RepID=UPI001CBC024F|nr:hypothetical protein [Pseudomonas sp. GL-B-16]